MRHHSTIRFSLAFACLGMFILLTGCSGQQTTTLAEEETLVPGPEVAEPVTEPFEETFVPEPEPELATQEFEFEPMAEPEPIMEEAFEPEPMVEEAFVAEPEPMIEEAFVPEPVVEVEEIQPEPLPEPTVEPLVLEDVYFDFDRSSIRREARMVLEDNARRLQDNNGWSLTIEGHCDERGTSAYNMVLGERRAEAVKRYLENLGVPGYQIDVVSYGEERPFCSSNGDYCWQENRRAHFVY